MSLSAGDQCVLFWSSTPFAAAAADENAVGTLEELCTLRTGQLFLGAVCC